MCGQVSAVADWSPVERGALLAELIAVDLEYRWRSSGRGELLSDALGSQPRLEDYAHAIGDHLPTTEWPLEMIAEEYRARRCWGDRPHHAHYLARFPTAPAELLRVLQQVDQSLAVEASTPPPTPQLPASNDVDPRAPLPLSDFIIQRHLGSGGTGKVYCALQKSLDRPVAIKALLKRRQADAGAVERFLHEARLLAQLRHPQIVGVHGMGRFPGGGYFMVLDLIEGESLLKRRQRRGPFSPEEAIRIVACVASAVDFAHRQGIVHCDLSPGNLLLDDSGEVHVTDFGFAQLLLPDGNTPLAAGGTLPFMAPEQWQTDGQIGAATDVYGLGAVLRWMLLDEACSRNSQLAEICQQATHPDPAQRFVTAAELAARLRAI